MRFDPTTEPPLPEAPAGSVARAATASGGSGGSATGVARFGSGGPFEQLVGYSRVVRAGDLILVSGCTAISEDGVVLGPGDVFVQAQEALGAAERALAQAGAELADVIRTRVYLTDIAQWEIVGRAHAERFSDIRPVTTMVEVSALIDPRMLVEIEVEAYRPRG